MFHGYGRAAFLASVTVSLSLASPAAEAAPSGPTFACFNPRNAALIGRLGPADASVRHAFAAGACLALPPTVRIGNVERRGNLWRFKALGAGPDLYAADWAAGFAGAADRQAADAFAPYLRVTGRLLEAGYGFADCYDAGVKLSQRWRDFDRRWQAYQRRGTREQTQPELESKLVLYLGGEGPRLLAEAEALDREGRAVDRRCEAYQDVEADADFLVFVRSARHSV